jgi:ParB family chromosome partitioning protein
MRPRLGPELATEPEAPRVAARAAGRGPVFDRVALDRLDLNPDQPRRRMRTAGLSDLTLSVQAHGVLQPIRVRRHGDRFQVIAGHRRVIAARRAGLGSILAIIADADHDQALVEALIENIQREDLNPVERGEVLRRLRVSLRASSWEEVGRLIGISRRHVYHLLNVADLSEPIREDIEAGNVSEKHARALRRLRKHPELQLRLWRQIVDEGISGDGALDMVRELVSGDRPGDPSPEHACELGLVVKELLRVLPRATMHEIRPLRHQLERLSHRLSETLGDGGPRRRSTG